MNRRTFISQSAAVVAGMPLAMALPAALRTDALEVHIFSKHLQFLDYDAMARTAKDLGFAGIDLSVRPGGHVEPGRVTTDLPRAVEAMTRHGLRPGMMVTALTDTADPLTRTVLSTARQLGFTHYRTGWLSYPDQQPVTEAFGLCQRQFTALAQLNREIGITGMYQNHAGQFFGAAIWDLHAVLSQLPDGGLGSQFDVRHATVEGASIWHNNLRLIAPFIRSIALKDFTWSSGPGGPKVENVPIGQGMVDFKRYFAFLKQAGIRVPASLHLEYPLGGADEGKRTLTIPAAQVRDAMRRDLEAVKKLWEEA
jgi:sugar phosphate isomerase/epimerase